MSMTKEDFLTSLRAIETECSNKKSALCRIYVQENAKAQIGAIVTDGFYIIKVEQHTYSTLSQIPVIAYTGVRLTKNLKMYKRREVNTVHESNENFRIIKK